MQGIAYEDGHDIFDSYPSPEGFSASPPPPRLHWCPPRSTRAAPRLSSELDGVPSEQSGI